MGKLREWKTLRFYLAILASLLIVVYFMYLAYPRYGPYVQLNIPDTECEGNAITVFVRNDGLHKSDKVVISATSAPEYTYLYTATIGPIEPDEMVSGTIISPTEWSQGYHAVKAESGGVTARNSVYCYGE